MTLFHYQALDANGRLVRGDLEADDAQLAVGELHARGLRVQSIGLATLSSVEPAAADHRSTTRQTRVPAQQGSGEGVEQTVLRSHMATILERGRAIAPALRAYAEEMPAGWKRRQLLAVCRILERGDAVEAAADLAELPDFWIPLLSAATTSPDPGRVLREFLSESQRTDDLRQQWWLTLVYPLVIAGLATAVMTVLSVFVIPEFREIFADFGLALPALTRFILNLGTFFSTWGVLFLAALGVVSLLLVLNANRLLPASGLAWIGEHVRLPFGRRAAVARFARFTADLLEAGVSMPDSLRIAGFTVHQSRMQRAAWQLASDLESTGGLSQRADRRALTSTLSFALAPEMQPESRIRLLREVSNCQAERVRLGMSWTTGIVEPLAIGAVGLVVGCTVLALFLPLVTLVNALTKLS
jgi:type II secretory pathway component PulF